MSQLKDIPVFKKKNAKETVTPHRLTVAILIRDFCDYRELAPFKIMPDEDLKAQYRRGFCLLILKLIQSPDLTLDELRSLLASQQYCIDQQFIETQFEKTLEELRTVGMDALLDIIDSFHRIIVNEINSPDPPRTHVNKNSITGYFLRRLLLSLDKLSFGELTLVLEDFKHYHKPLDDTAEAPVSSIQELKLECGEWLGSREQWARRQAELFVATQAALVTNNEEKATNPAELQQHIKNLLKSNPDLAEAHFLSYLNYLRVKEFCGAVDSLHQCFDKSAGLALSDKVIDEKSKYYRYAALNLAVLHYHFAHKEEALVSLREAIRISQEANDNVCLQHALSWLYCLTLTNTDKLIEHSILKSLELNLSYTMSFGMLCFVQFAGMTSGNPKQIFETMTKDDIINCQHNHWDLIANSYMERACLWLLYGKTEMSSLWSQLYLFLNTDTTGLSKTCYGEGVCHSICNVSNHLLLQGEYQLVHCLLNFAKDRFPNEPVCHNWMWCEGIFTFTRALHRENWAEAEAAAQKMAVVHKWESCLRLAELHLHQQDFASAHACVSEILDKRQSDEKSKLRIDFHVRALILLAEIQCASSFPENVPAGVAILLNSCLSHAYDYHLDYYTALIYLHLANVQLLLGMPAQALKMLDQCIVQILAHGGCFDRARAMLMYAKCKIAHSSQETETARKEIILDAIDMLDEVKELFEKVEAYARVKNVLYMQAHLCHEIGLTNRRNKYSMELRILDEEYPSKNNCILLRYL